MIGEITGLVSSLKAAKDIAETMIGLRDTAAFQGKAIEFQSKILDSMSSAIAAQEERAALLQKIDALEKEVARLETWEAEKQRYELKDAGGGALAYALKEEARGSEPPHWICPQCYQDGKKSILQSEMRMPARRDTLVCHGCSTDLILSGYREPTEIPSRRRR